MKTARASKECPEPTCESWVVVGGEISLPSLRSLRIAASGGDDGRVYRPIIPFRLEGPSKTLDFFGLLDTGADETYITQPIADRLGLDILEESDCTIESASGVIVVRYGIVTFELSDGTETYQWHATVGITDQDWSEAILGHSGFLEYYDVLFRGQQHEVELTRNSSILPSRDD